VNVLMLSAGLPCRQPLFAFAILRQDEMLCKKAYVLAGHIEKCTGKSGNGMTLFYISNCAFRKIIGNFQNLMNVEMIDKEVGYPE